MKINPEQIYIYCHVDALSFQTQHDKGEEASGSTSPAPLNQPPPPSRPTHRWHVIARHWLRQTRRRTSGVLPVTTRKGFFCLSVAETHFSWSNASKISLNTQISTDTAT